MKYTITLLVLFFSALGFSQHLHHTFETPEGKRSDTLNVLHYDVDLDLTDSIGKEITGIAELLILSKIDGLTNVNLDLIKLDVDSVWENGSLVSNWNHNDTLLSIPVSSKNTGDTIKLKIAYHGVPFGERWGGWYNNANYIFNLGVGFESIPHNLGKVWHPCVDNFIERATYTVALTTFGSWIGVGSGILDKVDTIQQVPIILKRTWKLNQEIPTYLYGIAAGKYVALKDTFNGPLTTTESYLYVLPNQITTITNKTQRLEDCFKLYEDNYGKYRWDRVGFATTSQGAMEHATNIAIPASVPETTIMHELSHHWWGDLITCESDRDMWINEGMAVFSEYLFTENLDSKEDARANMYDDLYTVISQAHKEEGGYQPISGVPRVHTYGTHTYRKGALVGHNLRVKLGDAKTFSGFTEFLDSNAFSAVNSYDLRDGLTKATGIDLTDFFDDWVFSPGMPCYVLDSFELSPSAGLYNVELSVRQLKANSDHFFADIPLEIKFMDAQFNEHYVTREVGGELTDISLQIPINATYVTLNPNYELNYAMTSEDQVVNSTGTLNTSRILIGANISSVTDSAYVRTQAYWTGPNISLRNAVDLGVRVNNNRYWRIDGVGDAQFTFTASYIARKGDTDFGLVTQTEDSLVLLYRPKAWQAWEIITAANFNVGLATDSVGNVVLQNAEFGEYVFAEYDSSFNESLFDFIDESVQDGRAELLLFPNPAKDNVSVELSGNDFSEIVILNYLGEEVQVIEVQENSFSLEVEDWKAGVYFFLGYNSESSKPIDYKRFIKQ